MTKNIAPLLAGGLLALAGCSAAKVTPLTTTGTPTVFLSKLPPQPYAEVAYVESTGSIFTKRGSLLRQLQQKQATLQGDALVQLRYDYQFWWPHASAVVIKYQ